MHSSSYDKMRGFRDRYLDNRRGETIEILDLGSQDVNGTYRDIFTEGSWTYTGIDMAPGKNVDLVLGNPYRWSEIKSGTIDVVISGQAFEHIEYFWITMLEVARVLKVGGLVCIIVPSGGVEHRYPVDCWRFYPDGVFALGRFAQLHVLEAITQWEDIGYADGSDMWHDTILVAQRPKFPPWNELKSRIKRFLQHRTLSIGL